MVQPTGEGGRRRTRSAASHQRQESPTSSPRARRDANEPGQGIEGPLEDAASVLREPVDLERSLLDEAELGTEEIPEVLAERSEIDAAADEATATLEAESMVDPPRADLSPDVIDPEELEGRLEDAAEPAELLSLHDEEPLFQALLDEGVPLDELEEVDTDALEDALEDALTSGPEQGSKGGRRPTLGRPFRQRTAPVLSLEPLAPPPQELEGSLDAERFGHLLEEARAHLDELRVEFEREGLRQQDEREDLSSLSSVNQHPADLGTETFIRERDLSLREQVEDELAEVEEAQERLRQGTYGRCEACGRPIGVDRLAAEPATRFCLNDQLEREREISFEHREVEP